MDVSLVWLQSMARDGLGGKPKRKVLRAVVQILVRSAYSVQD